MHILLLAEGFTPEPVVGAFRIRKLAAAFAARGHQVTVVVALAGGSTQSGIENVHLEVEPLRQSPREMYIGFRDRFRRSNGAAPTKAAASAASHHPVPHAAGAVKRFITSAMHLPDDRQGVIPALLHGVRNVEARGPFDLVYSSAPAFSVQLAARRVSKRLGIPWFMEFRDPWRTHGGERIAQMDPVIDRLDAMLEASCVRAATAIVAVSGSAGDAFRSKVSRDKPVLVALNGIERVHDERPGVNGRERTRIVYAGSLYPPRDPRPLLESIARCVARGHSDVPEFVFVGHCHAYDGESLQKFAERHGIGEHFRMLPWLPQAEAQELVASADLALLPSQHWTQQIPNKLFDYLGCRVPILALASVESETARLLAAVGGHFVVNEAHAPDIDDVVQAALTRARDRSVAGNPDVLCSLTVAEQFRSLTHEVERIMSERAGRTNQRA